MFPQILLNILESIFTIRNSVFVLLLISESFGAVNGPTNCTEVSCPPFSEIYCPEDSIVRQTNQETNVITTINHYEILTETFVQCCVAQKCMCRTCYIPSCLNSSLVLIELKPESQVPGKCCGTYECDVEPDCSDKQSIKHFWLSNCERCNCVEGKKQCIKLCDQYQDIFNKNETIKNTIKEVTCFSEYLNQYFSKGDNWKEDACKLCECIDGFPKCRNICTSEKKEDIYSSPPISECFSDQLKQSLNHGDKWKEDNCTHCECISGLKICENLCNSSSSDKFGPMNCISSSMKRSFSNGETWYEDGGCSFCKCENGERQCQTSFCKPLHCEKKTKNPGQCCPQCFDEQNTVSSIPASFNNYLNISTPFISFTEMSLGPSTFSTNENKNKNIEEEDSNEKLLTVKCKVSENSNSQDNIDKDYVILYWYWIITGLVFLLLICMTILCWNERRKRLNSLRSYDPVSNIDDNCNKIATYSYSHEDERK